MITLLQINLAINDIIIKAISETGSHIKVIATDVLEPIVRPSIKVLFENAKNGRYNNSCRERSFTCRIYYFPKDKYKNKFDIIQIQEIIENAFMDGFYVDGFHIPVDSVESDTIESILICSFNIYAIEELPNKNTDEVMQEIEYKKG